MTVDDVYKIHLFAINDSINGDLSKTEFNRNIKLAEASFVNFLLGVPEQYQYRMPTPRVQYGMNATMRQKAASIIPPPLTLTVDGSGNANYPSGYILTDAMYTTSMRKITFVTQDKLSEYLGSDIDPIADNPIFLIEGGRFQFYPITIGSAKISYVKTPTYMYWGSTPDVNGRDVYDAGSSVQPSWSDIDLFEIISRSLRMVGVNLQLPLLYQYSQNIQKEGA